MFSVDQKRRIADAVHRILRETEHPELPPRGQPIRFLLHVDGAESWSWADIRNNEAVTTPGVNPWNEKEALASAAGPAPQPSGWQMDSPHPFYRFRHAGQWTADVCSTCGKTQDNIMHRKSQALASDTTKEK